MVVPLLLVPRQSALVMTTFFTPASTAASAFSILGSIPPDIVPSAVRRWKPARVIVGITLLSLQVSVLSRMLWYRHLY